MISESDVSTAGNGQDAEAMPVPKRPRKAVRAAKAAKPAKNKPAKAPVKAKGTAKAKPGRVPKARKTRTADPAKQDQFGLRKGSIKSRAAAMYASKKGATLNEVKEALDSTQFNVLTELEGKGFKIARGLVPGIGARQATRYKLLPK